MAEPNQVDNTVFFGAFYYLERYSAGGLVEKGNSFVVQARGDWETDVPDAVTVLVLMHCLIPNYYHAMVFRLMALETSPNQAQV
jgi:hypothetical protein